VIAALKHAGCVQGACGSRKDCLSRRAEDNAGKSCLRGRWVLLAPRGNGLGVGAPLSLPRDLRKRARRDARRLPVVPRARGDAASTRSLPKKQRRDVSSPPCCSRSKAPVGPLGRLLDPGAVGIELVVFCVVFIREARLPQGDGVVAGVRASRQAAISCASWSAQAVFGPRLHSSARRRASARRYSSRRL
jgi:hypothetical protein